MTPRKPRPAPKKKFKVKAEPIDPGSGEDDSDMKKAAKMRTRLSTGTLTHKSVVIPGSSDGFEDSTAAAEGSSADADVVVVSDDDDTLLPPASTLGSTTWDPTPSTLFNPPSPNQDPPTFYDDFAYHSPPADDQFSPVLYYTTLPTSSIASTSAGTAPGPASTAPTPPITSFAATFDATPAWTHLGPYTPSSSSSTIASASSSSIPPPSTEPAPQPRFRRMGAGRSGRDPWAKPAAN
ncbi:hypothetical protein K438DRAFT_758502 [Mycena galopus ATCC 62051]|nr:hypothetical protein K438DRAFT_758502 [Mycena galopus ATCC 62051]